MSQQTIEQLSPTARELERVRTQRSILRDGLLERRDRAADLWLRALVAETPLADRDYRLAEVACRRVEAELARLEDRLRALEAGAPRASTRGRS